MPNIEKRRNVWFATLHVPTDVQEVIGKGKFFQTLQTTDKRIAEQRAAVIVAQWKAEISKARGKPSDPVIAKALMWRQDLKALGGDEDAREAVELLLTDHAEELEAKHGLAKAQDFVAIALTGREPLGNLVPGWKAQLTLTPKTMDQMEKDVGRFVEKFATVERVTPKATREWLLELAAPPHSIPPDPIQRIANSCRNFWRYLQETGEAPEDEDPPIRLPSSIAKARNKARSSGGWEPFNPAQVVALHKAALEGKDQELADLILLGAYTGARIEEICSLKLAHVAEDSFSIVQAKTTAGIREVPIHSELAPVVARLRSKRGLKDDGYLLAGLTASKYGVRSNSIGRRFSRLRDSLGFEKSQVFHSLRKTFVTLLENAGVPENLTADIVGHDKPRLTYGLYSAGATLETKREAIELVRYPF